MAHGVYATEKRLQVPITSGNVQQWLRMDHTPWAGNWIRLQWSL